MKNKINQTVKKYNLLSKGDTVLIAFSGGADSVMLSEYLLSVKEEYSLTLKAAHIEHGIRGEESLNDCRFVKEYCNKNGIELGVLHISAIQEAEKAGMGVEEYSRNKRYEYFSTVDCDKIDTAHNLSDNAETLLFRLARGTSLKGACSIPPARDKIIRPLIELTSKEIRDYLDENSIKYCVDSTNACNDYSRNFIRNVIIPEFQRLNPDFENAVSRFISSISADEIYLEKHIEEIYNIACESNMLKKDRLLNLTECEQKRIISRWLSNNNLPCDFNRIEGIYSLITCNSKFQIMGSIFAVSNKDLIRIADISKKSQTVKFKAEKITVCVNDFLNKCEFSAKQFDFYCDYDKIIGSVQVRCRQSEDSISPLGRSCTKTLKKLFNELQIPIEERSSVPVITDDKGVIGVYGYCTDKRVAVDGNTKTVLILKVSAEDND